jgi:hypothetical protein
MTPRIDPLTSERGSRAPTVTTPPFLGHSLPDDDDNGHVKPTIEANSGSDRCAPCIERERDVHVVLVAAASLESRLSTSTRPR